MTLYDNDIMNRIRAVIKQTDPEAMAFLYGSRATGKATAESDWDILVLLNKPIVTLKDEQLFRHNLYNIEVDTGELISTFVYSQTDWDNKLSVTPLYQTISKEGIRL